MSHLELLLTFFFISTKCHFLVSRLRDQEPLLVFITMFAVRWHGRVMTRT